MQCITDLEEIFRLLQETCGDPVYIDIGEDENGDRIAVPCYAIGGNEKTREEKKREREKKEMGVA